MDSEWDKEVKKARAFMVVEAEAMAHSLDCPDCGLQYEAEITLAIVGWSREDFDNAVEAWYGGHE